MIDCKTYHSEATSLVDGKKRIIESAELIIWECREREKFQTNKECLRMAVNCMAYVKVILGYVS